jgi:hypothetical protein
MQFVWQSGFPRRIYYKMISLMFPERALNNYTRGNRFTICIYMRQSWHHMRKNLWRLTRKRSSVKILLYLSNIHLDNASMSSQAYRPSSVVSVICVLFFMQQFILLIETAVIFYWSYQYQIWQLLANFIMPKDIYKFGLTKIKFSSSASSV